MIKKRVGLSGTGFIACQLLRSLLVAPDLQPSWVFSQRPLQSFHDFILPDKLTSSLQQMVDNADVVVECSGDPRRAALVVQAAFERGLPVVTMNTEFHVTCGSPFVGQGYLTEGEGDQPGALAQLAREAGDMGFLPLVYGNMKGFLELNPSLESMLHWSQRLGITLPQVTAFTDGSKLQMEQALVANGLGAGILCPGLTGLVTSDRLAGARQLGHLARQAGQVVVDYLLDRNLPPGVFITATHREEEAIALRHYKLGEGPYYVLERPFHLCALELPKTIRAALRGDPPLLTNSSHPTIGIAAIAKRDLAKGTMISRGLGGFDVRGECVTHAAAPDHLPLGIVFDGILRHSVEAGTLLTWNDMDLPPSLALDLARRQASVMEG